MRGGLSPLGASVVSVALVLAACGEAVPGHERLAGAAERTQQEDTAHLTVDSRLEEAGEGGGPMEIRFSGEGQVDFAAERMHLVMQLPGRPAEHPMETIHDADVVYMRPPVPDAQQRWVRHEPDDQDLAVAASRGMGGLGGPMPDPAAMLAMATRPAGEIEELGRQEVREVATTGYGFHTSVSDLLDLDAATAGAEHLEDLQVEVAAWLDREDRVRRLRLSFDLATMHEGMEAWSHAQHEQAGEQPPPRSTSPRSQGTFTTTIEWFDFGEPVDITVPGEEDLIDQDTLREEMVESDSATAEAEVRADPVAPDDAVVDEDEGTVRAEPSEPQVQEETRADQSAEQLWGRTFVSVAVSESGQPRPLVDETRIELTFDDSGTERSLRWWAGCNHHGSSDLELTDTHLSVGQVSGTDADCDPPELHAQDDWLKDLLQVGVAWHLDTERLLLTSGQTRIELAQTEGGPTG